MTRTLALVIASEGSRMSCTYAVASRSGSRVRSSILGLMTSSRSLLTARQLQMSNPLFHILGFERRPIASTTILLRNRFGLIFRNCRCPTRRAAMSD
jgi:hypothetical protein